MDFNLTSEETLLQDTCRRLFAASIAEDAPAFARESPVWQAIAGIGLTGLHVPDSEGGQASSEHDSAVQTFLVCQAAGHALLDLPYTAAAVETAPLLLELEAKSIRNETIGDLLSGRTRGSIAHSEGSHNVRCDGLKTIARASGDAYTLNGVKYGISHGSHADYFIVTAQDSGSTPNGADMSIYLVPRDSPGVRVQAYGQSGVGANLQLNNVKIPAVCRLGRERNANDVLRSAAARGIAARLAEQVGIMSRLLEMSVRHLQTRRQFGKPLAEFQALQHQLADMATSLETSTSMALMGVFQSTQQQSESSLFQLSAAKAFVGRHSLSLAKMAVQLHGGIGMTEELLVGKGFRRLIDLDAEGGNHMFHLQRYASTELMEH